MGLDLMADALSWLAYCFAGYMAWLVIATVWKGRRPRHAERWMRFVKKLGEWRRHARKKIDGWAHTAPIAYPIVAISLGLLTMAAFQQHSNIVTQHNVAIYRQLDNGDWQMSSDEDDSLVFRPCVQDEKDGVHVNSLLREGIGYIADVARWEERGTCKSILRSDLGFWFKDKHNNFTYRKVR